MRRVLVTGGAGFVGSHLCDLLVAQGHTVIAFPLVDVALDPHIARRPRRPERA